MQFDIAIRNGTVVAAGGTYRADVGVVGERIVALGDCVSGSCEVDATGCYVLPGGIDPHVHLQMSQGAYVSADDFASGTIAAACGGTTTVIDFVEPAEGDGLLDALQSRREEADHSVSVDYSLHMTIPAWHADRATTATEIEDAIDAGCTSFKLYLAYSGLQLDDVQLYRVLGWLTGLGGLPMVHCENGPLCDELRTRAVAAGRSGPGNHALTRPPRQEAEATGRAIDVAALAGSPLYVVHVSCAESLDRISMAKRRRELVYGETCPQYLFLQHDALDEALGERLVCAPPLRTCADNDALWRALATGALDALGTDHCPFSTSEKLGHADFTTIPGGLPSIEARLGLAYDGVNYGWFSLERWVAMCCTGPARIFGLTRKGQIAPGFDADLVVFDPMWERTIIAGETLHERVDWSPYSGRRLRGWPRDVFLRGRQIVRCGEFVGAADWGRFVTRCRSAAFEGRVV